MKISQDGAAARAYGDVVRVHLRRNCHRVLLDRPGHIGDGGNSGFQAINLAAQFGARRIVLVGFDMRLDQGVHWHGRHPPGLNNPRLTHLPDWRVRIDRAAHVLAARGIEAVNASPVSALTAFPFVPLEQALHG